MKPTIVTNPGRSNSENLEFSSVEDALTAADERWAARNLSGDNILLRFMTAGGEQVTLARHYTMDFVLVGAERLKGEPERPVDTDSLRKFVKAALEDNETRVADYKQKGGTESQYLDGKSRALREVLSRLDHRNDFTVAEVIKSGEMEISVGDIRDYVFENACRLMDKSGTTEILGEVLFKDEEGVFRTVTIEAEIGEASPDYIKEITDSMDDEKLVVTDETVEDVSAVLRRDVTEEEIHAACALHFNVATESLVHALEVNVDEFDKKGGRGVDLADNIDRLQMALAARGHFDERGGRDSVEAAERVQQTEKFTPPPGRIVVVNALRRTAADKEFENHDFEPEVVKDTGGWSFKGDVWKTSVYLETPGQTGPSRKVVFRVVFLNADENDRVDTVSECGIE